MFRLGLLAILLTIVAGRHQPPDPTFGIRGGSSSLPRSPPSYFSPWSPPKLQPWSGSASTTQSTPTRDAEDVSTKEIIDSFLTRDSRTTFIARVYAILGVQLIVTALSCAIFGTHPFLSSLPARIASGEYQGTFALIPLFGVLISSVSWFRVSLSPNARHRSPNKWWWLGIFTLGESLSVGFLTTFFKFQSVILSMVATAIATISISAFTILQKNPKYDLSQWGNTLSSWALILLMYLVVVWFQQIGIIPIEVLPFSNILYSFVTSCLFSAFLAYHTKLIVGGKHAKYRMNEKDYVLGAMALYDDIVNLFLNILQILGEEKD
ncbi:unnamed protein product [Cylindrotheca closterium]|uniref:BI1-like protein n=1 Tax=Cylindrotheca closterium TaxID=2856 RepID=A0AAD2GCC8_9STRA|nr:unnamed protein product [Cylindrotheca closterium]